MGWEEFFRLNKKEVISYILICIVSIVILKIIFDISFSNHLPYILFEIIPLYILFIFLRYIAIFRTIKFKTLTSTLVVLFVLICILYLGDFKFSNYSKDDVEYLIITLIGTYLLTCLVFNTINESINQYRNKKIKNFFYHSISKFFTVIILSVIGLISLIVFYFAGMGAAHGQSTETKFIVAYIIVILFGLGGFIWFLLLIITLIFIGIKKLFEIKNQEINK